MTDIINKLKFIPSLKYNKGYTNLSYIHIDITSRCNLRCITCNWRYQIYPNDMSPDLFYKIISDCKKLGLRKVVLGATGEPLLNPNLPSMLKYLNSNNIETELVTNLTIYKPELLLFNKITASIDGATKNTYDKIRIGADFDKTLTNLIKLSKEKPPSLFLDVNYVINKENYFEIEKFFDLVQPYVNAINYKFIHISTPETSHLKLSDEEIKTSFKLLESAHKKANLFGIKINNPELSKPYIHDIPCYNLWFGLYISPSGLIFPCCNFYEEKDSLGNLNTNTMKEIWKSDKYNSLRKSFKGKKPLLCEHCPGDNKKIHDMVLKIPFHKILLNTKK